MKKTISPAEHLQLIGLVTLARHHDKQLDHLKDAAMELLGISPAEEGSMNNPADHVSDMIYGSRELPDLLSILSIRVSDEKVADAQDR